MKTFKSLVIFFIVILAIIFISYIAYDGEVNLPTNNVANQNEIGNLAINTNNENNNQVNENTSPPTENEKNNEPENIQKEESSGFIGKEEQESQEGNKQEINTETQELTGEEKAVDIVKNKYAASGETVRFDHMEAGDYVVKINNGTAVTWYIVDGETWKAEEY